MNLDDINQQIKLLEENQKGATKKESIKQLESFCIDLKSFSTEISEVLRIKSYFEGKEIPVGNIINGNDFKTTVKNIENNFIKDQSYRGLKGEEGEKDFKNWNKRNDFIFSLKTSIKDKWDSFFNRIKVTIDSPNEIGEKVALDNPKNQGLFDQYEEQYNEFIDLADCPNMDDFDESKTNEQLEQIQDCKEKLISLRDKFDMVALPEAVESFFRAVKSDEGATLELFNKEVETWLTESNLMDEYRIKKK